jgi:hypothetical protein
LDFPKGKYWIACGYCDFVSKSLGGGMPLPYSANGAINPNLFFSFGVYNSFLICYDVVGGIWELSHFSPNYQFSGENPRQYIIIRR